MDLNIQYEKLSMQDALDRIGQHKAPLDILLIDFDQIDGIVFYHDVEKLLQADHSLTLVRIREKEMTSQLSVLESVYERMLEESPSESHDVLTLLDMIELELGEFHSCVLAVEDFSSCSEEQQASLLELAIVSKSIKLLLGVHEYQALSSTTKLWNVLEGRVCLVSLENITEAADVSSMLEQKSSWISEDDDQEKDLDDDIDDLLNELESSELEENDLTKVNLQPEDLHKNNIESDEIEISDIVDSSDTSEDELFLSTGRFILDSEQDELNHISTESSSLEKKKAWYQLIPKIHFLVVALLGLVILALWNIDLNKTKREVVDVKQEINERELTTNATLVDEDSVDFEVEPSDSLPSLDVSDSDQALPGEKIDTVQENLASERGAEDNSVLLKKAELEKYHTSEEITSILTDNQEDLVEENSPSDSSLLNVNKISVESELGNNTLVSDSEATLRVDSATWSPYQSSEWINSLDPEHYSLQILASGSRVGIREFLDAAEQKKSYAVFTSSKDNKPWHVVIFGVYDSYAQADEARKVLPQNLRKHSPWIRSMNSIQQSILEQK